MVRLCNSFSQAKIFIHLLFFFFLNTDISRRTVKSTKKVVKHFQSLNKNSKCRIQIRNFCSVTHLESEGPLLKVWGQTDHQPTKIVETILNNLTEDFRRGIGSIGQDTRLFLNTICCAYYEDGYYRARICKINRQSGSVLVRFIDYGNLDYVPYSSIRLLDFDTEDCIELQTIPDIAMHFTIARVLSFGSKWDPKVLEQLKSNILYKEYLASIGLVTYNQRMLNIFFKNKNFSDYIVQKRLARRSSNREMINAYQSQMQTVYRPIPRNSTVNAPNGNAAILSSTTTSEKGGKQTQSIPKRVKLLADDRNIGDILVEEKISPKVLPPIIDKRLSPLREENSPNVFISNVFSPAEFSIQAECKIPDLEIMAVHLEKASNFLPLKTLKEKTICAAQFPEDGLWYRAEILCHSESETEVLYIDYGNTAITCQLRALTEIIINIPPLLRLCSLVMPKNIKAWSKKACEKFFELVADGQTMFQYKQLDDKSPCHISLSIDNQDILEILIPLCTEIESTKVNTEITAKNDNHDSESQCCNSSNTSGVGPSGVSSDASACELQISKHIVVDCLKQNEYSISQDITEIIEQSRISEIVVKQSEDKKDFQKQEETANETDPDVINKKKSGEKEVVQLLKIDLPNTEINQIKNLQVETTETTSEISKEKINSDEKYNR